jgi:peptidoglycan/xylan/chitin deacetylase (PgdA/CDA1 family)
VAEPRAPYSAIVDRPPLKLPNGARVAVWVCVNVEEWEFGAAMARTLIPAPQGASVTPDVPNYSWYDYGMRVGFWRFKEVLDRHGIKATVSLNSNVCASTPRIVEACLESDWELMGHGVVQRVLPREPDERAVIRRTIDQIEAFSGRKMRGWMGPGLHETYDTPDILVEEGIEYCADWVNDVQPYPMRVKQGTLISIPYTVELNDIPIYLVQQHRSPELYERGLDEFETLHREGAESARVMCVSVHPYITGAAHRIKYFDRLFAELKRRDGAVFMRAGEILDWYRAQVAEA